MYHAPVCHIVLIHARMLDVRVVVAHVVMIRNFMVAFMYVRVLPSGFGL